MLRQLSAGRPMTNATAPEPSRAIRDLVVSPTIPYCRAALAVIGRPNDPCPGLGRGATRRAAFWTARGCGVRELIEMTIGRTEDLENPIAATAFKVDTLFGTGSRNLWTCGHRSGSKRPAQPTRTPFFVLALLNQGAAHVRGFRTIVW